MHARPRPGELVGAEQAHGIALEHIGRTGEAQMAHRTVKYSFLADGSGPGCAAPHRCRRRRCHRRAVPDSAGSDGAPLRCEHRRWRHGCIEEPERTQRLLLQLKHVVTVEVGHARIQRAVAQVMVASTRPPAPSTTKSPLRSAGAPIRRGELGQSSGGSVIEMH